MNYYPAYEGYFIEPEPDDEEDGCESWCKDCEFAADCPNYQAPA